MTSSVHRVGSLGARGFTLMEIIVVVAVMGLLLGASVPIMGAFLDQERDGEARTELEALAKALEAYYQDHGRFPRKLDDEQLLGAYLQEGVYGTAVTDAWGSGEPYAYGGKSSPDVVHITSRGRNGRFERGKGDDIQVRVAGAPIGNARTHARIRVITAALVPYLAGGGKLTGRWRVDLAALGLAAPYDVDGFGTPFQVDRGSQVVRSAGADRKFGTKDDLTS